MKKKICKVSFLWSFKFPSNKKCIHFRYGKNAGELTEHTLYSAGNIAMTAYNANHLGVKAIAKRAAKDTGKAVLEDFAADKKGGQSKQTDGATAHDKKR